MGGKLGYSAVKDMATVDRIDEDVKSHYHVNDESGCEKEKHGREYT